MLGSGHVRRPSVGSMIEAEKSKHLEIHVPTPNFNLKGKLISEKPELIAYNSLAAGWNMVVMDELATDSPNQRNRYRRLSEIAGQERQRFKVVIAPFIDGLHCNSYVHGDVHDANFFVTEDSSNFQLVGFHWAGPVGRTHYPMCLDRQDIRHPDHDARDGTVIQTRHDLDSFLYQILLLPDAFYLSESVSNESSNIWYKKLYNYDWGCEVSKVVLFVSTH